jgi:hypothetical protein
MDDLGVFTDDNIEGITFFNLKLANVQSLLLYLIIVSLINRSKYYFFEVSGYTTMNLSTTIRPTIIFLRCCPCFHGNVKKLFCKPFFVAKAAKGSLQT